MPYIKTENRDKFTELYTNIPELKSPGELNYLITIICQDYIEDKGLSYQSLNDVIGALEGCKLEFYRRRVAPYEDMKIQLNGDVF